MILHLHERHIRSIAEQLGIALCRVTDADKHCVQLPLSTASLIEQSVASMERLTGATIIVETSAVVVLG